MLVPHLAGRCEQDHTIPTSRLREYPPNGCWVPKENFCNRDSMV